MEIKGLIQQIRDDVKAVRDKGQQVIDATALDQYLAELARTATLTREERARNHEAQMEQFKATHQSNLAHYAAQIEADLEMFRTVITTGQAALRGSMLINGGAAVAVLGFLSNAWSRGVPPSVLQTLPASLLLFGAGVLGGALAAGATYLSQEAYASKQERLGKGLRALAIALVVGSYIVFAWGAWEAYNAFLRAGA